jgi:hypothetical protein
MKEIENMFQNRLLKVTFLGLFLLLVACAPAATEPADTSVDEPVAVSHGNEIGDYVDLVDALRTGGAIVDPAGEIEQPFFSVGGQLITLDGGDVQVFEYTDADAAAADAALISPDGSSVGLSMINWMAKPHFYAMDRIIVLYVGDDDAVVEALNGVLGQPVAEG